MADYTLFCDGSAKHGTGYFGYVLFKDKVEIDSGYGMIGQGIKPKIAEKYALSYGLDSFVRKWSEPGTLKVFGDAKQVIEKIEEDSDVSPKIKQIRGWGVPVIFKWIPRDANQLANDLARKMIDYFRIAGTGNRELKGNK
jgi:ribonuclease HI